MKMAVLYFSKTDNTKKMAEEIARGMMTVEGVEAKTFSIDAVDMSWTRESKCLVLGTPVYMASMAAEVKTFLDDSAAQCGFTGKVCGAYATANYVHGGGDLAIRTILDHLMVFGGLTYSGGGSLGEPVIHLGPVAIGGKLEEYTELFHLYGQRMAKKTAELFSN